MNIPPSAIYADFSTSSARLNRELSTVAAVRNLPFIDVAFVSIVPGNGLRTPAFASGSGAARFVARLAVWRRAVPKGRESIAATDLAFGKRLSQPTPDRSAFALGREARCR